MLALLISFEKISSMLSFYTPRYPKPSILRINFVYTRNVGSHYFLIAHLCAHMKHDLIMRIIFAVSHEGRPTVSHPNVKVHAIRTSGSLLLLLSRECNKKFSARDIRVKGCLKRHQLWRYSASRKRRVGLSRVVAENVNGNKLEGRHWILWRNDNLTE